MCLCFSLHWLVVVVSACQQMIRRITQLVFDSFGDQFYAKALECIQTLRGVAVKVNDYSIRQTDRQAGRQMPNI